MKRLAVKPSLYRRLFANSPRIAPYTRKAKPTLFQMANGLDLTTITSVLSVTTFIIGILLGVIIKRAIKLALAIVALVGLLVVTGYLNFAWSMPSANTIYYVFNGAQPVASQAIGLGSLLPISSVAFLAGAAIGLWKG